MTEIFDPPAVDVDLPPSLDPHRVRGRRLRA